MDFLSGVTPVEMPAWASVVVWLAAWLCFSRAIYLIVRNGRN